MVIKPTVYYLVHGHKWVGEQGRDRMTDEKNERQRDSHGQFKEETTNEEILASIRESEFPAVTARWVADTVGIERTSAHRRLESLVEDSEVKRGKLSPRVVIWWVTDEQ